MNLHNEAAGLISSVNPYSPGELKISNGYTVGDDGSQIPSYKSIQVYPMQVQPLGYRDLMQIDGLNLQGVRRKIYINGRVNGLVRIERKGGDIIRFLPGPPVSGWPYGTVWLIVMVLEQWPDWTSVAATLQNGE